MTIRFLILSLILGATLMACSNTGHSPTIESRLHEMGYTVGESNIRIPSYRINGWNLLDERNLVITAGVNQRYLVSLNSPCFGLQSAFNIAFTTPYRGGRLDRFEDIMVRGPDRHMERCGISDIYRLNPA